MRSRCCIVALLLTALCACVAPSSREDFVLVSDAVDGRYFFTLDFMDSTSVYDLYLCAGFDGPVSSFAAVGDLPLRVTFVSPEGDCASETVHLPLSLLTDVNSREMTCLYRSGIQQKGKWKMVVYPLGAASASINLRGLGYQMVKKKQDG